MKVLLSIKPEFVKEIFEGRKRFEYRKSIFTKDVTSVIVYSTKPVGLIVGEFEVRRVLCESPEKLWSDTCEYSGITKDFFDQYFIGRSKGYALQISNPRRYKEPINPFDLFASFVAPQSFKYIEENQKFLSLAIN